MHFCGKEIPLSAFRLQLVRLFSLSDSSPGSDFPLDWSAVEWLGESGNWVDTQTAKSWRETRGAKIAFLGFLRCKTGIFTVYMWCQIRWHNLYYHGTRSLAAPTKYSIIVTSVANNQPQSVVETWWRQKLKLYTTRKKKTVKNELPYKSNTTLITKLSYNRTSLYMGLCTYIYNVSYCQIN